MFDAKESSTSMDRKETIKIFRIHDIRNHPADPRIANKPVEPAIAGYSEIHRTDPIRFIANIEMKG